MRKVGSLILCYITLNVVFTIALVAVFSIPTPWMLKNLHQSAEQIVSDGIWPQIANVYFLQVDNMTDCIMLNISACADYNHPLYAAMMANIGQNFDDERYYKNIAETTLQLIDEGKESMRGVYSYGRYWHGYQVILRPLLLFFHYHNIIFFNMVLLFLIAGYVVYLLWKRHGSRISFLFFLSLLFISFPIVPCALQFSTCFYIALLGMLWVMKGHWIRKEKWHAFIAFFVLGGCTSFMDLLTTPQVTLGLPLIVWILEQQFSRKIIEVIRMSSAWLLGYASIWITKWALVSLFTGESVMESVQNSVELRISHNIYYDGKLWLINDFLNMMFEKLFSVVSPFICILIIVLSLVLLITFIIRQLSSWKGKGWLLLIVLLVPCWYICLLNHSIQHVFFTWRALIVTVFGLMLLIFSTPQTIRNEKNSYFNSML